MDNNYGYLDQEVEQFAAYVDTLKEARKNDRIGILRKAGYEVQNSDFFKIGIPFTMSAVIPAYIYLWLMFGV